MDDGPEHPGEDPARTWDDGSIAPSSGSRVDNDEARDDAAPTEPDTVGTGSYVAVSCVAAMGLLLVVLIVGLLISRWIG